ncbi:MAG: class I SAM-dependent methyltransferase [Candidatus Aenigmarchaeota archaeon]|nr:class I SAM-dependent methyltransferase [Candidatus Aenigmarchaeota archaeon]
MVRIEEDQENIPGYAARLYDKLARDAIDTYYTPIAKEIAEVLSYGKLLDVGTGPGYLPIELVKLKPDLEIYAVDLTPELIEIARENVKIARVNINFEVGSAYHLRFEDDSFDMVISTGVIHDLANPVKALDEWYRVLKPGREAWVYDPTLIVPRKKIRFWYERLDGEELVLFKEYAKRIPPIIYTTEELKKILNKTKFKEYEIKEYEMGGERELKIKLKKVPLQKV